MATQMSTNITQPAMAVFSEAINKEIPILDSTASSGQSVVGRTGGKIEIALPDPGTTVITRGEMRDLTGVTLTQKEWTKKFEISTANNSVEADIIELTTDIDSFDTEVVQPRCASIGDGVGSDVVQLGFATSDSALEIALADLSYDVLGDMAGYLGEFNLGELHGYMSSIVRSKIAKRGLSQFNSSTVNDPLYKYAEIGEFSNVMWKKSKMPLITIAAANVLPDGSVSAVDFTDDNAAKITIADAAITTGTTIKKGSTFRIAGIYVKDALGNETMVPKTFVVQSDAVGVTGAVTLDVGPCLVDGAHANVTRLPIVTDSTVTAVGASAGKYSVIWGFERGNLIYDGVDLRLGGFQTVRGASINSKVKLTAIVDGEGRSTNAFYRFDAAYIAGARDSRRSSLIYVKMA